MRLSSCSLREAKVACRYRHWPQQLLSRGGGRGRDGIRILLGMGARAMRKGMLTGCEKVGAFSYRVWEKLQR